MERSLFSVGYALQLYATIPLDGPGNPSFVSLVGSPPTPSFAANKGFIHFDNSQEGRAVEGVIAHRFTDAVTEIPSRLVGHFDGPLELKGGYALLGFTHQVNGDKPLPEGQMGIVHNSSGGDGELIAASVAVELPTSLNLGYAEGPAPEAGYAVRPTELLQKFPTLGVCVKVVHKG